MALVVRSMWKAPEDKEINMTGKGGFGKGVFGRRQVMVCLGRKGKAGKERCGKDGRVG